MDASLIPVWITTTLTAGGVVYAIVRNGSRGKEQDEQLKAELKLEIKVIKKQLDDPENGLSAIKKSVDDQRLHCVATSTRLEGQVITNASEIDNLRTKKN